MPLLYGEGARSAFYRLQAKILGKSHDDSLFAWDGDKTLELLAPSPSCFWNCQNTHLGPSVDSTHFAITGRGVEFEIRIPARIRPRFSDHFFYVLPLNCHSIQMRTLSAIKCSCASMNDIINSRPGPMKIDAPGTPDACNVCRTSAQMTMGGRKCLRNFTSKALVERGLMTWTSSTPLRNLA